MVRMITKIGNKCCKDNVKKEVFGRVTLETCQECGIFICNIYSQQKEEKTNEKTYSNRNGSNVHYFNRA